MKSISDTFATIRAIISALSGDVKAALVGGYTVILHGLERTILDVDLCLYSGISSNRAPDALFDTLKAHLPEQFRAALVRGTLVADDPFQHDLIVIDDRQGDFPRIDLMLARPAATSSRRQASATVGRCDRYLLAWEECDKGGKSARPGWGIDLIHAAYSTRVPARSELRPRLL